MQVMDALKFLDLYAEGNFDLIFADPPYAKSSADRDFAAELLQLPALVGALRPSGTFVLERLAGSKEPEASALSLVRVRRYGESEIAYYLPARMTAVRILYNLAFPFVLLALLPGFLFRMLKRGKYRHKFGQRFAIYSPRVRQKLSRGGWTWVHAVSVGEVLIALKLIREMKNRDPQLPVVLSTTTSTGFALASREQGENFETIYNPIDFFWTARRAVRLIRPRRLILVEAEVWPNLTAEAKARGATLALVNARLSSRSESRYRMIRPLASAIFNQLDLLCVQEPADAKRWESLGVDARKILCTGSIKFDDQGEDSRVRRNFRQTLAELGVGESAPVILAGSTHSGEECLIGEIVIRLKQDFPNLFYVVVPRHAERWREVREQLDRLGLRVALREAKSAPPRTPILSWSIQQASFATGMTRQRSSLSARA